MRSAERGPRTTAATAERPVAAHVWHRPWLPDDEQRLGGLRSVDPLLLALRLDPGSKR